MPFGEAESHVGAREVDAFFKVRQKVVEGVAAVPRCLHPLLVRANCSTVVAHVVACRRAAKRPSPRVVNGRIVCPLRMLTPAAGFTLDGVNTYYLWGCSVPPVDHGLPVMGTSTSKDAVQGRDLAQVAVADLVKRTRFDDGHGPDARFRQPGSYGKTRVASPDNNVIVSGIGSGNAERGTEQFGGREVSESQTARAGNEKRIFCSAWKILCTQSVLLTDGCTMTPRAP